VALAESLGVKVTIPHFLAKNQKQLTYAQANESRLCTALRWVAESVNGRLKKVFPFSTTQAPTTTSAATNSTGLYR
jgi:hypothetical protein